MKRVKIVAGICWAFAGLILIIVLFPGLNGFSNTVSRLPFMKLNPRYTGGEVVKQTINEKCTLDIRKPVFNGFLKERRSGFVQVDWRGTIPESINDSIDYDGDGKMDFYILINKKLSESELKSFDSRVKDIVISTPTSYGWSVRIGLLNQ
jgi:hypothetical protein